MLGQGPSGCNLQQEYLRSDRVWNLYGAEPYTGAHPAPWLALTPWQQLGRQKRDDLGWETRLRRNFRGSVRRLLARIDALQRLRKGIRCERRRFDALEDLATYHHEILDATPACGAALDVRGHHEPAAAV
jgi:hypothetical protein